MRWYWWIPIMIIVVATKATIYFAGEKLWALLFTPEERTACLSGGYAGDVVIAGCTKMIESRAYEDKDVAVAYYARAHAFARQGKLEDALRDYSQALALNPRYLAALNNRAHTLMRLGRYKDAVKDLDDAIALWPDFRLAILNRAISLRNIGRYEQALADADRAIALDDADIGAHRERGVIKGQMGDLGEAIRSFSRAIEIDPRDFSSYFHRGRLYFASEQYDKAVADLSIAHDLLPHDPHTLLLRAESYERSGNRPAAIADYRRLRAIAPDNYPAQLGLARLGVQDGASDEAYCNGSGDPDARLKACARAIASGKLSKEATVKALLTRATLHLYRHNDIGAAADEVDRAAAIAPDDLKVMLWRGSIALQLKSYVRAMAIYDAILKRAPDHEGAKHGRAHALLGLKRYSEALPEFERAVTKYPEMADLYLYRAQAYEGLGRRAEAIRDYRTAYRRSPNLKETRQGLARLGEEP